MGEVFISHASVDADLARRLVAALGARGVEASRGSPGDVAPGPARAHIERAETFVFVLTPASLADPGCRAALTTAAASGRRLVALRAGDPAGSAPCPPELLGTLELSIAADRDLDRCVEILLDALGPRWEDESDRPGGGRQRSLAAHMRRPRSSTADARRHLRGAPGGSAVVAAAALVAVASLALAAVAFVERDQARRERDVVLARDYANRALATVSSDPRAAVALAARAVRLDATPQAHRALLSALRADHQRLALAPVAGGVSTLSVDPSGRLLAVGAADGSLRIVALEAGRASTPTARFAGTVDSLSFDRSGSELVAGGADGTAAVIATATGQLLERLRLGAPARITALNDDGTRVLTVSDDHVELWNARTGARVGRAAGIAAGGFEASATFVEGGRLLAAAGPDGVSLLDARSGLRAGRPLPLGGERLRAASFSSDGRFVAVERRSAHVEVWDLRTRRRIGRPFAAPPGLAPQIAPGGRVVALEAPGGGSRLSLYDSASGRLTESLAVAPRQLAFSRDGRLLVTVDYSHLRVWDVETGAQVEAAPTDASTIAVGPHGRIAITADESGRVGGFELVPGGPVEPAWTVGEMLSGSAISPDGRTLLAVSAHAVSLATVHAASPAGAQAASPAGAQTARALRLPAADGAIRDAELSPDGRDVAVAGTEGVTVFDARTRRSLATLPAGPAGSASFSRDGRLLVVASEPSARVWNWRLRAPVGPPLPGRTRRGAFLRAALSPDAEVVAIAGADGSVQLWDARGGVRTGPPLAAAVAPRASSAALSFSPDGRRLLTSGDVARLWDTRHGALLEAFPGSGVDAALSPDGSEVATTGDVGGALSLRVWRAAGGRPLTPPLADPVLGDRVAFSPDGRYVAAGDTLWDASSGLLVERLNGDFESVSKVAFAAHSPDLLVTSALAPGSGALAVHRCELCLPPARLLAHRELSARLPGGA